MFGGVGGVRGVGDELDGTDKRRYTVDQIAETFGVSRKTIYRNLEHDPARSDHTRDSPSG